MGIVDGGNTSLLAILAWVVAGALAIAIGGVILGICAYRRGREAEARLRMLEVAVGEFCEALRARLAFERGRRKEEGQEEAG